MGTPDYMPPEQAQGRTAYVDHRGDQYSLAVIVYEMLAGRGPFQGDMMEILEQVIRSEAPRIEDLVPDLPAGVGTVLRRAMAKAPEQRFDTIVEFAKALGSAALHPVPPASPALPTARALLRGSSAPGARPADPLRSVAATVRLGRGPAASSSSTAFSQATLLDLLEQAKKARSGRDIELAATLVEQAMSLADVLANREAEATLEREEALLEGCLEMRLGRRQRALRLLAEPEKRLSLSTEEAFLLSRIDGVASAEEVLDLSPLPRLRTLRLLVRMICRELISNG